MKKIVYLLLTSLLFISCNDRLLEIVQTTSDEDASRTFVENICIEDSIYTNNAARNVTACDIPSFFYTMKCRDEAGNVIDFASLAYEDKIDYVEWWKQERTESILAKMQQDPVLSDLVKLENEAFSETLNGTSRAIRNISYDEFIVLYQKNEETISEQYYSSIQNGNSSRTATSSYEIKSTTYKAEYMKLYSENYQQGRILVASGTSSSSSSAGVGHAAIMSEDKWDVYWSSNGLSKTTYTAWPKKSKANQAWWSYKEEGGGVQKEPVGYWVGDESFNPSKVSIYDVLDDDGNYASTQDYQSAAGGASNYENSTYNIVSGKYNTDKMYCSKLVWRVWYDVDDDRYDLVPDKTIWVKPADLAASGQTKLVKTIKDE